MESPYSIAVQMISPDTWEISIRDKADNIYYKNIRHSENETLIHTSWLMEIVMDPEAIEHFINKHKQGDLF